MANYPTRVIVHCSDTPDFSTDNPQFDSVGVKEINQWHLDRGWKGIGYHYVIRRTGVVETAREEGVIGAHCKEANKDSLGVCLVGRGKFTPEQKESLLRLFIDLGERHRIGLKDWYCHYQFNKKKTCPNVKMDEVHGWLRCLIN